MAVLPDDFTPITASQTEGTISAEKLSGTGRATEAAWRDAISDAVNSLAEEIIAARDGEDDLAAKIAAIE